MCFLFYTALSICILSSFSLFMDLTNTNKKHIRINKKNKRSNKMVKYINISIALHMVELQNYSFTCLQKVIGVSHCSILLLFCMGCYAGVVVIQYWVLCYMSDSLLVLSRHRPKGFAGIIRPSMYM